MSGGNLHVHGPHDHAVEHATQAGSALAQQVAMFTAILATLGAFVSYQGGATQNEAMLLKNEAVLKKAEASDQWAFYQAKSLKEHLSEVAAAASADPLAAEKYRRERERYAVEKKQIKIKAETLDEQSHQANLASDSAWHPHHRLAQAMTLIQISISLASITVLTRRRWLMVGALMSATVGMGLWIWSYF